MKITSFSIFFAALLLSTSAVESQSMEATHSFEKGQVVDFLFLNTKPDTEGKLKDYFDAVFPIVKDAGYRPLPGFRISQNPTQGNHHPDALVIATWRDKASRAQAMKQIEQQVPKFHQRRMEIWSSFDMTVYEMTRDISFSIHADKTYVLTAYWQKDESFDEFKRQWLEKTRQADGQIIVELEDGVSPFGYHYKPDYMTITEWDTRESFDRFYEQNLAMDHGSVEHVNQFILDLNRPKK